MKTTYHKTILMVVSTLSFILAPVALPAAMSLKVGTVESGDQSIEVPISAVKCDDLGALQFLLTYDAEKIEPTSVEAGSDLTNGLVQFKVLSPGTISMGLVSGDPVKGAGELLIVTFKRLSPEEGKSELTLDKVFAWEHKNGTEMLVTHEPGSLVLKKKSGLIPGNLIPEYLKMPVIIGAAVLILLILILIVALAKRGKKQPPSSPPVPQPSPGGAFCPECGSPHGTDAKFCPKCGQVIAPPP